MFVCLREREMKSERKKQRVKERERERERSTRRASTMFQNGLLRGDKK